jgi:endonuclease VIII
MPEGDTIHYAARRIRPVLVDTEIQSIETPQARHRFDRWPERLGDRRVRGVDAHGKHLFLRFEGELTIHSHLRMGGLWGVFEHGQRWRRSPRRAWLVIKTATHAVVQFDGPVLELMTDSRTRFDQRLAALGPDVLADDFDDARFLRRLREDDQTRTFGDALLDQRNVAGIGNIWKAEGCWEAAIDPWRRAGSVSDEEALAVVAGARPRMLRSATEGHRTIQPRVYGRAGRPCPRCGTAIQARGQGDDNRLTYWCPGCQR